MCFSLAKTSRPSKHLACVEFLAYAPDVSLCIVKHLQQYLKHTDILRGDVKQLFISYSKPHKAVSPDTVSRWLKTTLIDAGIDTSKYSAHSTRSASTYAAKGNSISIATIMKSDGWSQWSTKFTTKFTTSQWNLKRIHFGAELLNVVTTKIVSYICMFDG